MKNLIVKALLLTIIQLIALTSFSQEKKISFDELKFIESEYNEQMVYIKWYSTGRNAAPDFIALRYEKEKPVLVNGIKMLYKYHDTTFYVIEDTLAPKIKKGEVLQYFITPHDTARNAGKSTDIVLITSNRIGNTWFIKTRAEELKKVNGNIITWHFSDASELKRFEIFRSTDFVKDFVSIASLPSTDTSYLDYDIIPDIVYYYRIQAVFVNSNRPVLSNTIFSAGYNPQPPIPPFVKSINGIKGGAVLTIQVTDPEVSGVRVYRDDGKDSTLVLASDLIKIIAPGIITYTDTSAHLSGRLTYTYAVKAESRSFVESGISNKVYVRPLISKAPDGPLNFSVYEESGSTKLFWDDMQTNDIGIAGYEVYRKDDDVGKTAPFIRLLPEKTILRLNNYLDTTVVAGKSYTYRINAVDIDGNISKEGAIASVIMNSNLPIEPFALRGYKVDDEINLQWSQTIYDDIVAVNLYRYQRGSKAVLLSRLPADAIEYADKDIKPNNLYFYYLTTVNKSGLESRPSEEVAVE